MIEVKPRVYSLAINSFSNCGSRKPEEYLLSLPNCSESTFDTESSFKSESHLFQINLNVDLNFSYFIIPKSNPNQFVSALLWRDYIWLFSAHAYPLDTETHKA